MTDDSVILHLNGQTDKHQGRQARIYETACRYSLELAQNDAFSPKTEQKRATTENYSCTGQTNSFFVIV